MAMKTCLTLDPDGYRVLDVADLIGSSAYVFTSIIKIRLGDLNHLVEVLHFHTWCHNQVVTILGPGNMGSGP